MDLEKTEKDYDDMNFSLKELIKKENLINSENPAVNKLHLKNCILHFSAYKREKWVVNALVRALLLGVPLAFLNVGLRLHYAVFFWDYVLAWIGVIICFSLIYLLFTFPLSRINKYYATQLQAYKELIRNELGKISDSRMREERLKYIKKL